MQTHLKHLNALHPPFGYIYIYIYMEERVKSESRNMSVEQEVLIICSTLYV